MKEKHQYNASYFYLFPLFSALGRYLFGFDFAVNVRCSTILKTQYVWIFYLKMRKDDFKNLLEILYKRDTFEKYS
jgi:hypothetical protein